MRVGNGNIALFWFDFWSPMERLDNAVFSLKEIIHISIDIRNMKDI